MSLHLNQRNRNLPAVSATCSGSNHPEFLGPFARNVARVCVNFSGTVFGSKVGRFPTCSEAFIECDINIFATLCFGAVLINKLIFINRYCQGLGVLEEEDTKPICRQDFYVAYDCFCLFGPSQSLLSFFHNWHDFKVTGGFTFLAVYRVSFSLGKMVRNFDCEL